MINVIVYIQLNWGYLLLPTKPVLAETLSDAAEVIHLRKMWIQGF